MHKYIRVILILTLMSGILMLAKSNTAWASPAEEVVQSDLPQAPLPAPVLDRPEPGSVKPPPRRVKLCEDGVKSVGGVAVLKVTELERGYCVQAFLWNHKYAFGRIPKDSGKILAHITFLQIFHYGRFVQELPAQAGNIEICYAVPPGKQAQIYFYDYHRSRHKEEDSKAANVWEPLPTTVTNGIACVQAQFSGAYALIGK